MTSLLQRKRKSVQPSRFWNRQNLLHACTKIREHNRGFVLYFSNWLARNWSTQAHEVKTTCAEQFWTVFDTKNFVLCCFPSLTVQEVQISREHVDGEKRWVIIWSTKSEGCGIGPVKPMHMVFSDDESFLWRFCWKLSCNTTGCAIYSTHDRFCFHHG